MRARFTALTTRKVSARDKMVIWFIRKAAKWWLKRRIRKVLRRQKKS